MQPAILMVNAAVTTLTTWHVDRSGARAYEDPATVGSPPNIAGKSGDQIASGEGPARHHVDPLDPHVLDRDA